MLFFLLFGRGLGPRPNSKKKHAPAQTAKKITPEKPKQQKRPDNKKINILTACVREKYGPERLKAPWLP